MNTVISRLKEFWTGLAYKYKGTIARGLRVIAAGTVGIVLTAATQGILFPATMSPMVALVIIAVLQMADKYLREKDNPEAQ